MSLLTFAAYEERMIGDTLDKNFRLTDDGGDESQPEHGARDRLFEDEFFNVQQF